MKYQVTNGGHRGKAFKVFGGLAIVASGKSDVVETEAELTEAQIFALKNDGCVVVPVSSIAETERPQDAPTLATAHPPLTDDQLRDMIEQRTGKRPHHRTGRAKLIEALA